MGSPAANSSPKWEAVLLGPNEAMSLGWGLRGPCGGVRASRMDEPTARQAATALNMHADLLALLATCEALVVAFDAPRGDRRSWTMPVGSAAAIDSIRSALSRARGGSQ